MSEALEVYYYTAATPHLMRIKSSTGFEWLSAKGIDERSGKRCPERAQLVWMTSLQEPDEPVRWAVSSDNEATVLWIEEPGENAITFEMRVSANAVILYPLRNDIRTSLCRFVFEPIQ